MRPRSQEIDTGVYVSSGLLHRSRVDEVEEPSQMLAIKLKDASQTQEVKYHMLSYFGSLEIAFKCTEIKNKVKVTRFKGGIDWWRMKRV